MYAEKHCELCLKVKLHQHKAVTIFTPYKYGVHNNKSLSFDCSHRNQWVNVNWLYEWKHGLCNSSNHKGCRVQLSWFWTASLSDKWFGSLIVDLNSIVNFQYHLNLSSWICISIFTHQYRLCAFSMVMTKWKYQTLDNWIFYTASQSPT